jgi:hypothetical protein
VGEIAGEFTMADFNVFIIGMLLFGIWMTLLDIRRALFAQWRSQKWED